MQQEVLNKVTMGEVAPKLVGSSDLTGVEFSDKVLLTEVDASFASTSNIRTLSIAHPSLSHLFHKMLRRIGL
jgi:hypothetical protein